jgi:AAA+ superfamily predicted ATPase
MENKEIEKIKNEEFTNIHTPNFYFSYKPYDIKFINFEQFKELYKKEEFISNYKKSVISFCKSKIKKYETLSNYADTNEIKKNLNSIISKTTENDIKMNFDKIIKILDDIVDRDEFKNIIVRIFYSFSKNHMYLENKFLNFCLYGSPGTGKTNIAKTISECLLLGYIITRDIEIKSPGDFKGSYVGESSNLTIGIIKNSLDKVLFIDEAYQFGSCSIDANLDTESKSTHIAIEIVTELVNSMDKLSNLIVFVFAGYKTNMINCFFKLNPGLNRRIPYILTLNKYGIKELTVIFLSNIYDLYKNSNIKISKKERDYIYSMLNKLEKYFPNGAGDILNLTDDFIEVVSNSIDIEWIVSDFNNNKILINRTFQLFLNKKGIYMHFENE